MRELELGVEAAMLTREAFVLHWARGRAWSPRLTARDVESLLLVEGQCVARCACTFASCEGWVVTPIDLLRTHLRSAAPKGYVFDAQFECLICGQREPRESDSDVRFCEGHRWVKLHQ